MLTERSSEVNTNPDLVGLLNKYLELQNSFEVPPEISLSLISQAPEGGESVGARDIAISTAVQCYAPGIAKMSVRESERMQKIAESTLKAGHHTTRMHTHYTWQVVGVSRNLTHDVAHSHPFYNSEQQSQRYVEAKSGSYLIPSGLTPEQRAVFVDAADYANSAYFQLLTDLHPIVDARMHEMYPRAGWKSGNTKERLNAKSAKICQEITRYVLPIAQKTNYYHTLSEIQLLRMFRATSMGHCSDESRFVVASMINEVAKVDPTILLELELPFEPTEDLAQNRDYYTNQNTSEFDELIGEGQTKLVDYPMNLQRTIPFSVRNVLAAGKADLSDAEAWSLVVDPAKNPYISDSYDVGMLDGITQTLRNANFVWATKLSHAGDSQRQRHRRTPGVTPALEQIYTGQPDYITPMIIAESHLQERYDEIMSIVYQNVQRALDSGIPAKEALSLLPNAQTVRVVESGDLFDWQHRLKQRLCYLAQEEIFFISVAQAEGLAGMIPDLQNLLLAPCGIREIASQRPRCPEGDRWCGQPVFHWTIQKYKEMRLI